MGTELLFVLSLPAGFAASSENVTRGGMGSFPFALRCCAASVRGEGVRWREGWGKGGSPPPSRRAAAPAVARSSARSSLLL